jgi:hypothetical protein
MRAATCPRRLGGSEPSAKAASSASLICPSPWTMLARQDSEEPDCFPLFDGRYVRQRGGREETAAGGVLGGAPPIWLRGSGVAGCGAAAVRYLQGFCDVLR